MVDRPHTRSVLTNGFEIGAEPIFIIDLVNWIGLKNVSISFQTPPYLLNQNELYGKKKKFYFKIIYYQRERSISGQAEKVAMTAATQ